MVNEKENVYLCVIEIQETRKGEERVSPLPIKRIEFKFRRKKEENPWDFAKGMFDEEVKKAEEKGTIIYKKLILYKEIMKAE